VVSYRHLWKVSAANEEADHRPVGCARYAPDQDTCDHVSAGQGRIQQRPPEPLLLRGDRLEPTARVMYRGKAR
jgi:hypothetical protein